MVTSYLGPAHLKQYFNEILKKGGEGVVLRKPASMYQPGRSESLCKYKVITFQSL
jgi:ATP-dependent DNA ligase